MSRTSTNAPLPSSQTSAFTLTEIVLCLGIIATAMVALIGLLPVGVDSSREATNHTIVASILEDVHNRLEGEALKGDEASFSPAFYDEAGILIPADASEEDLARRLYRAEVRIGSWEKPPENTSSLRPVTVRLYWPVNAATGEPPGNRSTPQTVVTYAVTALTGPDWQAIDKRYVPKVEF
ncbi:hypothetical protein ACXR0O_21430 [Verrucomicrobiota bacterium sgz303538]